MPQLIFKGVKEDDLKAISIALVDELSKLSNTPRDYFVLELVENKFIYDGGIIELYPIVEVKWFDRGEKIKQRFAETIDSLIRERGYEEIETFFTHLREEDYCENKKFYK